MFSNDRPNVALQDMIEDGEPDNNGMTVAAQVSHLFVFV